MNKRLMDGHQQRSTKHITNMVLAWLQYVKRSKTTEELQPTWAEQQLNALKPVQSHQANKGKKNKKHS